MASAYRSLARRTVVVGPVNEAVLRFAVVLWLAAPDHALPADVVEKLRARLTNLAPLTPAQHAWLVPRLLAWAQGTAHYDALLKGLRGVVDAALLPEEKEA